MKMFGLMVCAVIACVACAAPEISDNPHQGYISGDFGPITNVDGAAVVDTTQETTLKQTTIHITRGEGKDQTFIILTINGLVGDLKPGYTHSIYDRYSLDQEKFHAQVCSGENRSGGALYDRAADDLGVEIGEENGFKTFDVFATVSDTHTSVMDPNNNPQTAHTTFAIQE